MSNCGRLARLEADEVRLEARDQPVLADDERHPVARAALERDAVPAALEPDDRPVAVLRRAVLDRGQDRVLVAQLVDDLVDLVRRDLLDLRREVEVRVVAERDLGPDLDGRLELEGLALLRLDQLHVRVGERDDPLLDDRVAVGVLDQVLDRLVEHGGGSEDALEDRSRGLARPEAGDARAAREAERGIAHGAVQPVGGHLDLEEDGALGCGGGGHIHRRASIGWVAGPRPPG